ncbi:hypothetical protein [Burkholderia gladioli]|uniref:hypothetical protein n=1 Tax=Burkholderia gladioli TaxID=28095 RepID=UPI0016407086|nr:hypothetical protein [Burkholderia gladioli]
MPEQKRGAHMSRGMFEFIKNESSYKDADKKWQVELLKSDRFWYDLVIDPPDGFDVKKQISDYLKDLQAVLKSQVDKRFVYFLGVRKRVRFSMKQKPRYSFFGDQLNLYVTIGRSDKIIRIKTKIRDPQSGRTIKPRIEVSERLITICVSESEKISMSIHDFLLQCSIDLGIDTEVHYVGSTQNPATRPLNRIHRGFSDMVYRAPNEEYDYFVYYNLFKVISITESSDSSPHFVVANSMIDEIGVKEEGKIIENVIIKYFRAKSQEENKEAEEGELRNTLLLLAHKHKIKSISVLLEMEDPTEHFRFFSRSVPSSDRHKFVCRIQDGTVELTVED